MYAQACAILRSLPGTSTSHHVLAPFCSCPLQRSDNPTKAARWGSTPMVCVQRSARFAAPKRRNQKNEYGACMRTHVHACSPTTARLSCRLASMRASILHSTIFAPPMWHDGPKGQPPQEGNATDTTAAQAGPQGYGVGYTVMHMRSSALPAAHASPLLPLHICTPTTGPSSVLTPTTHVPQRSSPASCRRLHS